MTYHESTIIDQKRNSVRQCKPFLFQDMEKSNTQSLRFINNYNIHDIKGISRSINILDYFRSDGHSSYLGLASPDVLKRAKEIMCNQKSGKEHVNKSKFKTMTKIK